MKIVNHTLLLLGIMLHFTAIGQKKQMNVVLIMSDQHAQRVTGCYGNKVVKTPYIDALAEMGVRFTNFYTPAPLCAPARAAMMTGLYPYSNGAIYHKHPRKNDEGKIVYHEPGFFRNGYREGLKTIAEFFRENSYKTASIGKMHINGELQRGVDKDYPDGNDLGFDHSEMRFYSNFPGGHYADNNGTDIYQRYREFQKYEDFNLNNRYNKKYLSTLVENYEDIFDVVVGEKSAAYINDAAEEDQPFFLFVGLEKPHRPWTTHSRYLEMYDPESFVLPESALDWYENGKYPWIRDWGHSDLPAKNPEQAKNVMAAYYACITEMDEQVGKVINALEESGQLENTILIYTSDHGEHLFERGLLGKHNMFETATKIPFVIACPGTIPKNTVSTSLCSLVDLFPTLFDMIGIGDLPYHQGRSFYPDIVYGTTVSDVPVFSEFHQPGYSLFPGVFLPTRMVCYRNMKYVYTHGVSGQLYNLENDPGEKVNLHGNPALLLERVQLQLLALSEWTLFEYKHIVAGVRNKGKKTILTWEEEDDAKSWIIIASNTDNPLDAIILDDNCKKTFYELPRNKYGSAWIMKNPVYKKSCNRFPDIKMIMPEAPEKLPCSTRIDLRNDRKKNRHLSKKDQLKPYKDIPESNSVFRDQ
jgi:arylsulfatase A-like enzyme